MRVPEPLRLFQIDFHLRQFAEKGIGLLFLLKRLIEEDRSIVHAELHGPRLQGAVARHLVVLDGLTTGEEACVESVASRV